MSNSFMLFLSIVSFPAAFDFADDQENYNVTRNRKRLACQTKGNRYTINFNPIPHSKIDVSKECFFFKAGIEIPILGSVCNYRTRTYL